MAQTYFQSHFYTTGGAKVVAYRSRRVSISRKANDSYTGHFWGRERCTRRIDPEWREEYYVKDLKKIERQGYDLDRVLIVEDTPSKVGRNYGNAIYVTPRGQQVRIDVTRQNGNLVLRVRDHGPGISDSLRDRIFDPFFTTKPVGEGSGLGLSICLGIVEDHAGTLAIDNHPDGGAVAVVTLPLRGGPSKSVSAEDTTQ